MQHKVIVNPKTGRMETVQVDDAEAQADIARARRELRDMLAGNTPFHEDKLGPGRADDGSVGGDVEWGVDGGLTWATIPDDEWDTFLVECQRRGRCVVYMEYNPLTRMTRVQTAPVSGWDLLSGPDDLVVRVLEKSAAMESLLKLVYES